jgi:hypothetical protein
MRDPFSASNRFRSVHSVVIAAFLNLLQSVGVVAVLSAGVLGIVWVSFHAATPTSEDPPGSGIVVHTEVIAIWLPRALLDLARLQGGPPEFRSPEELQTFLGQSGCTAAWYALTCRSYEINGESGEITQTRLLSDVAGHLDELKAVMATAAGKPPRFERSDFSHASIEVIPDTLQGIDPCEAITRLMAPRVARRKSPHGAVS